MVSAFASQLQAIAKKSTNELDLKVRRNAHAESLLFERDVAVKQDFETLYNICIGGYRELCQLDASFLDFERNLYSEQSKAQDREQMSRAENEALDQVLKRCLTLLGGRILLRPAVKALEWLVRRFRVHIHNVEDLLLAILPFHEVPIWANTLSIIPDQQISGTWKFLRPYLKTTWNIPRHAVAFAASTQDSFFRTLNSFVLEACQNGLQHSAMMRFWSGITIEAISHRLEQSKSGRKELQDQKTQDLLHMILPLLSDGFEVTGSQDLVVTCYTISLVLAAKASLADTVLDSLLLAITQSLRTPDHDATAAIITMSVIIRHKQDRVMPRKVIEILAALDVLNLTIKQLSPKHDCQSLLLSFVDSSIHNLRQKNVHLLVGFVDNSIRLLQQIYPQTTFGDALRPVVHKVMTLNTLIENENQIRNVLITLLQTLNSHPTLSSAIAEFAAAESEHAGLLEEILGMTISIPESSTLALEVDVEMLEADAMEKTSSPMGLNVTYDPTAGSSFFCTSKGEVDNNNAYHLLSTTFEDAHSNVQFDNFASLPVWSNVENRDLLWQTFLLRFACTGKSAQARLKALKLLSSSLAQDLACNLQVMVAHVISLLENDNRHVRRAAGNLLKQCVQTSKAAIVDVDQVYGIEEAKLVSSLSESQICEILNQVIIPSLEECILDSSYIETLVQTACDSTIKQNAKRGYASALFNLLSLHALASPLLQVQLNLVRVLSGVEKVGSKSKRKILTPIVNKWMSLSDTEVISITESAHAALAMADDSIANLVDFQDRDALQTLVQYTPPARPDFVAAVFGRLRSAYPAFPTSQKGQIAQALFEVSTQSTEFIATAAYDTVRQLELDSEVLRAICQNSQQGGNDLRVPSAKRRKRSSSASNITRADIMRAVNEGTAKITSALELVEGNDPGQKPELISTMFAMLTILKQMQQGSIESPYLLNLCLGCIHAMLTSPDVSANKSELVAVKPELVTDCLRQSDNPQVQNASLLVLAALAVVTPDRMVHNVMPVFTFIGHNMLSKDDEHSVNVVNEAIDKIIPALLANLRKGKNFQSYQTSLASMLASFTAAYDHIPQHRRVAFYQKLLSCIDANEAGYMLLVLLVDSRNGKEDFTKAMHELVAFLPPSTQLLICKQLLYLSVDVLSKQPKQGGIVFNLTRTSPASDKPRYSRSSLLTVNNMLSSKALASKLAHITPVEGAQDVQAELQTTFESILTTIRDLRAVDSSNVRLAKDALDHFLQLASLKSLLVIITPRLDAMDEELCAQALRILANQIRNTGRKSEAMFTVVSEFMVELNKLADASRPRSMILASLTCINQVIEVYGRKNIEMVTESAMTVISYMAEEQDTQITVTYLLTAATAIDVMKEASVPLIPAAIEKLTILLHNEAVATQMNNAIFTLLASMFAHTAFMLSQDKFAQILGSILTKNTSSITNETYEHMTRAMSNKTDLEILVNVLSAVLKGNELVDASRAALLSLLSQALDTAPKSMVIRQAEPISNLFLDFLAIEAQSPGTTTSLTLTALNTTSIKYIYKLNDTTFRPIFESWIDWADTESKQIVLFVLLTHFFTTLGAIVTNFANHLLQPLSKILSTANPDLLLSTTLTLLRTITTHDQDSYFAAPSHFEIAKPLVALLSLAARKNTRPLAREVLPCIISLAKATMDVPATHSDLASMLVKFKSHESAQVRLASILAFVGMTEDEDLGDEFVSNVVGIGAGEGEGARGGSVGQIMVYVNEMLEDEDEEVEFNVRKWVQLVRAKVGEDVFEV